MMMQHAFDDAVAALRAAAEPTRLRLLALCADGELTVGEIGRVLGQSQPRVSRHLKLLCDAHLLERFREEHCVYYRVAGLGAGADLARELLGLVAPADPVVTRDRQHASQVRAARAAAAAEHLPYDESSTARREMTSELTSSLRAAVSGERIGQLLDIGSGLGRVLRVLGPEAEEAVGLDISVEALRFAPVAVLRQAAQALRPAGRVVLLDEVEKLTQRLGHPMIDGVLRDWLERAGFAVQSVQRVPARTGEIVIIVARRASRFEAAA
jgi:DNA-binding transcriptional ArsR family regulator